MIVYLKYDDGMYQTHFEYESKEEALKVNQTITYLLSFFGKGIGTNREIERFAIPQTYTPRVDKSGQPTATPLDTMKEEEFGKKLVPVLLKDGGIYGGMLRMPTEFVAPIIKVLYSTCDNVNLSTVTTVNKKEIPTVPTNINKIHATQIDTALKDLFRIDKLKEGKDPDKLKTVNEYGSSLEKDPLPLFQMIMNTGKHDYECNVLDQRIIETDKYLIEVEKALNNPEINPFTKFLIQLDISRLTAEIELFTKQKETYIGYNAILDARIRDRLDDMNSAEKASILRDFGQEVSDLYIKSNSLEISLKKKPRPSIPYDGTPFNIGLLKRLTEESLNQFEVQGYDVTEARKMISQLDDQTRKEMDIAEFQHNRMQQYCTILNTEISQQQPSQQPALATK